MITPMQDLKNDLIDTIKTGTEALNKIQDKAIKTACILVLEKTLNSVIERINTELLEKEKQVIIQAHSDAFLSFTDSEDYFKETFKNNCEHIYIAKKEILGQTGALVAECQKCKYKP